MRTALRMAVLAGLALTGGSVAAQQVGDPAPDFEITDETKRGEKITLERYKGRIIVLVFWRSTDTASLDVIPLLNKIHQEQRSKGVVVMAVTSEDKKDAEVTVKGKEIEYLVVYDSNLDKEYQVPGPPYTYLIDPQGIVRWRGHPEDNLEDRILELRRSSPPIGSDIAALENAYRKAEQLHEERHYGRAYTIAKDLAEVAEENAELGEKARTLMEKLEQAAEKWLEEAKEARRTGDYEEACRIVAEISIRFEGTDVAHAAEDEIARLRAERKSKQMIRTARKNAEGEMALDKAADFEASKQYLEALEAYEEVLEKFKETEAENKAQAAIERIKTDPVIQQHIKGWRAKAQADRWLDLGDRFAKVEMYDKAREYYEKVIREHPASPAATKAKKRLKDLPKPLAEKEADKGG